MKRIFMTSMIAMMALAPVDSFADELTLYAIAPRSRIDWESGPAFMATDGLLAALFGKFKGETHNVGHASVELNCEGSDGLPPRQFNAGMTTQSNDGAERELLFVKKAGLGVLLEGTPGRVETTEELRADIMPRLEAGDRTSFIKFKIRPETCRRLAAYYDEFMARGYDKHYGYPSRPREGQGAACTSFAYSFVDVAGLMVDEFEKNWTRNYRIPLDVIGRYTAEKVFTDPEDLRKATKVSAFVVLNQAGPGQRWACDDEPGFNYTARDVQFVYDWIQDIASGKTKSAHYDFKPLRIGKAVGIYADVSAQATPNEPLFLPPQKRDPTVKKPATKECAEKRWKLYLQSMR